MKKIVANIFIKNKKILSGVGKAGTDKAQKLSDAWDTAFNGDVKLDSDWSEAYNTNEQYSLRIYLGNKVSEEQ